MANNEYIYKESSLDRSAFKKNETLFTLANGYIGFRGNFEEGCNDPKISTDGTYLNGFYESEKILYGESAYGFPDKGQTLLNVIDAKPIKMSVDGEVVDLFSSKLSDYSRELDMQGGVLTRSVTVTLGSGKKLKLCSTRLVSMTRQSIAAISYSVTPLNFSGEVTITSAINGNVTNMVAEDDPRVGAGFSGRVLSPTTVKANGADLSISSITKNTKFTVHCLVHHEVSADCTITAETDTLEVRTIIKPNLTQDNTFTLTKLIAYSDDRFTDTNKAYQSAVQALEDAKAVGFDTLITEQRGYYDEFWQGAAVEIKGNDTLNCAMKLNVFHLLQSVGRDGHTNIAAKGLTGEGYEGHYFWDTETYILPFFLHTDPSISKKLLEYRYNILPKARNRAREMAHDIGALYPWRTIDGDECSAYFPAGTAQYHINADVVFALKRYYLATNDNDFMVKMGCEILAETARLWNDLGSYIPTKGGKFCINCVTGPDEYTAIVNNNFYTNLLASENLLFAADMLEKLKSEDEAAYKALADKISLKNHELSEWRKAGENIYLPYDEKLGINLQDDSFLDKAPWDFANTPKENYPLLIHYHPLVIYRHQVCKQADTVLAEFLCSSKFTKEQKARDYDFYEPLTTHDSSLSAAIFSIVACEIGRTNDAFKHFEHTALTDYHDMHRNTSDGIHAASMAGSWMCVVNGFAGMRTDSGKLIFNTMLPTELEGYSFRVFYLGRMIEIKVSKDSATATRLEGDSITISFNGEEITI